MIHLLKLDGKVLELANLERMDSTLRFDVRYARIDNFMRRAVYTQPRAFLLKHVAEDLLKAHNALKALGFGLLIFDGYRPWKVTKLFWDESDEHNREFLANPATGSSHNRGCAVDLSMYALATGAPVTMPSDFDEMNEKAYTLYDGGTEESRRVRDLLQATMKANGFTGIRNEWWHFNHGSHAQWPVMDFSFEEVLDSPIAE